MAKIKHTKNELKAQRESLKRFQRFLPMLQLKKQQLQMELQVIEGQIAAKRDEIGRSRLGLDNWAALMSEEPDPSDYVSLRQIVIEDGNVAGVGIPVLSNVVIDLALPDLFATPPWIDDAVEAIDRLIRWRVELEVMEEQKRLLAEELRVTSQRVNLFEKVKIPECKENIRVIKIFLGDEQTAGVARAKIAKARTDAYQYEDEAA